MDNKFPNTINIRVIGKCNLNCPMCFGPNHLLPSIDGNKLSRLIDILPKYGVEKVVITGGEPLLVPNLEQILISLRERNIKITLNTNGVLLERMIHICSYIDWLALPLDADNNEVVQKMRPGTCLDPHQLQKIIYTTRSLYPCLKIRIGTVVSLLNYPFIKGIPKLLQGSIKPDIWKLYQFTPESYGKINRGSLEITKEQFNQTVLMAQKQSLKYKIFLEVYRLEERDNSYLFINPNGETTATVEGEERGIGNIFSSFEEVLKNCTKYLNYSVIEQRSSFIS